MSNIFNKTNSPYLIAGTLATLALLASEVLISAPYFKFLAPVASLNVSFPLIIGCAVVSFAVLAFSCVMIASNIMKTESDDKVPILVKVEECDQHDSEQEKGNKPDGEPKLEEGAGPDSQANGAEGGTTPDSQANGAVGGTTPDSQANGAVGGTTPDSQANGTVGSTTPDSQTNGTAGGAQPDNQANVTEGGTTPDSQANVTVAPKPVPDIERDDLSGNSFTSGKVKEGQHAKVFAFASFVITGGVLFPANSLAGLIHNGVAVEGREMAVHGGQYQPPGYGSTQFEARKNSKGTDHLLQEAVQSKIVVFLKALKAGDEKGYSMNDEQDSEDNDRVPDNSLSYIQPVMGKREVLAY